MSEQAAAFDHKTFLKTLTGKPGVYRMLGEDGRVLYVGKARNLKNRVGSYFRSPAGLSGKTRVLMAQVAGIEVTVTHTENEALILENNLIKSLRPRYNILLRDDKSYPYIYLSTEHEFPRLAFHRGARKGRGRYFGPYPGVGAVRDTLNLLQKLFRIRQCDDTFFKNRSRPCLQYQIRRCTAPCAGYIDADAYTEDVRHAELFLAGRSDEIVRMLVRQMEQASADLDFESAARLRDRIGHLRKVVEHQYVDSKGGDTDIVALAQREGRACAQVLFVRGGRILGNKAWFPKHTQDSSGAEIMAAFLTWFYLGGFGGREIPKTVLVSELPDDCEWLAAAIGEIAGRKVGINRPQRGERRRWLELAAKNAGVALDQHLAEQGSQQQRVAELQAFLRLDEPPSRMECFDISHTQGEATVASCVVFNGEGPLSSDYRRFNISGIEPGDDYAAMYQALSRRYTRVRKEDGRLPDILFIDGGKGQVRQAEQVLNELQIEGVTIVGVAKGPARKAGQETLFLSASGTARILPADSPALHLVQQIRDEAHRFAITGHRQRRARKRGRSVLEDVAGVGARRRHALLQHFGGLHGVQQAGVEDLARIPGISRQLAQRIYDAFHDGP